MRIFVTGSSGFVGGAVLRHLRQQGFEAEGFSRSGSAAFKGDLLDPPSIAAALAQFQPQVVIHCAATTDLKGRAAGYAANLEGVDHMLAAVRGCASVKRGIWLSSQLVHRLDRAPASETSFDPVDAYGASKAEGEKKVRAADGGGAAWLIVRTPTIWGPGMSAHYAGVLRLIRRGLYFHVGRRPIRKSYAYIDTLAAQLVTAATAPVEAINRRALYFGDPEPLDVRAWADGFAEEWGRRIPTLPQPLARAAALAGDAIIAAGGRSPLSSRRLANLQLNYVHDVSAITALHRTPGVHWREGVRRTRLWLDGADPVAREDAARVPALT